MTFQGCISKDPPSVSIPLWQQKEKKDWSLKIEVIDNKTAAPLSDVHVEIYTIRGYQEKDTTNIDGIAQFNVSNIDSGKLEIHAQKSGYNSYFTTTWLRSDNSTVLLSMDSPSYLRCHVINEEPVSMSERIDIYTPTEYNYRGPTDVVFIAELYVHTPSITCKRLWNDIVDSTYQIPIHLSGGDTTDITITF